MSLKTKPELVHADPNTLVIGANVRLDPVLDKAFIASIKERGVQQPIVAYRDDDGQLVVLYGQRRTLAAVQAGRDTVPVMVTGQPTEADRLVDQVTENVHRAGLTTGERANAFEQMAALGLSAAQIAKRNATPRKEVDAALKVARSTLASAAAKRWEFLTLDQAATLTEFEDDAEAVKQLVVAAQRGGFDHQAQVLRDERILEVEKLQAAQSLAASGLTVIDNLGQIPTLKLLRELQHDGVQLTPESHAECRGHAAYLRHEWVYPDTSADHDDGPDGDIDREPDYDADDEPGEEHDEATTGGPGMDDGDQHAEPQSRRHASEPSRGWVAVYVCTDWQTHGHSLRSTHGQGRRTVEQMTPAEREAARTLRRDVIDSNKAWASAETVRRQWLCTFLIRKTAPKAAASFVASGLAHADHAITHALTGGNKLAHRLLGLADDGRDHWRRTTAIAELVVKASEARAQMITLGLLLAAYEDLTGKHSWRQADPPTCRYLQFLQANGYELSTVEQRACGEATALADGENADHPAG